MDYPTYMAVILIVMVPPVSPATQVFNNIVARCRAKCANQYIGDSSTSKDRSNFNLEPGCKTSCRFMRRPPVPKNKNKWNFTKKVKCVEDTRTIMLNWQRPTQMKKSKLDKSSAIVYRVLWRSILNKPWTLHTETLRTKVKIKRSKLPSPFQVMVIAVTEAGSIANITTQPYVAMQKSETSNNYEVADVDLDITRVNLTATVESIGGHLKVTLTWNPPPSRGYLDYRINTGRNTCNVDGRFPYCDIPSDSYANIATATNETEMQYTLTGLTFNSEYWVEISLTNKVRDMSEKITFVTPGCPTPDSTFEKCQVEVKNDTADDTDLFYLNVTSMSFDHTSGKVLTRLSWSQPPSAEPHTATYSIWYQGATTTATEVNISQTKNTHMEILLLPGSIFEIKVLAKLNSTTGPKAYYSESLFLNTTLDTGSHNKSPILAPVEKSVQRVVIGLVSTLSVILVSLAVSVIYKKRHTVREIIITKTAVSKSNSYKSSPGGARETLADELTNQRDEWEIDPVDIRVGSLLGQGAFGKVLTGYYTHNKVAIKVLKDNVPLSYKEDLLGEIALMKKLGRHRNIVSLVGACTLNEPIALIMEFVPFGNLQAFLKKCRVDGELQRSDDGYQQVACPLMNDWGENEQWIVTPADMLSFARQCALAMEYLAEKQYVHRDLAARNVLVGYHKVVKVCDFGLSRDVYLDSQYHKLTSGKLPLKWMALESLKDRIFTTNSDIWSFGVLLWEIVTMGCSPYPNIALADLYSMLADGYRMEKPNNCSDELYDIMRQCWYEFPNDRPNFTQIKLMLEELLGRDRDYLELDNISVAMNVDATSLSIDVSSLALSLESIHTVNGAPSTSGVSSSVPGKSTEILFSDTCMETMSHQVTDGLLRCDLPEITYSQV